MASMGIGFLLNRRRVISVGSACFPGKRQSDGDGAWTTETLRNLQPYVRRHLFTHSEWPIHMIHISHYEPRTCIACHVKDPELPAHFC